MEGVRKYGPMPRRQGGIGTFGSHLQHFARSVDIVDRDTLSDIRQLVFEYLQDQFDAEYLDLSIQHEVDGVAGLRTFWSSANRDFSGQIRDPDGAYKSQVSLCYGEKKPLWIVATDQRALRTAEGYHDMWSEVTELPRYRPPMDKQPLFTSVLIPVFRPNDRILGVMVIECSKFHDIADFDPQELIALADALGVLYDLHELHEIQAQGTHDAVDHLRRLKASARSPQIAKTQVFVAYSNKADDQVVGIIVNEIGRLEGPPKVIKWRDMEAAGQINTQIDEAINTSGFGVCYLSESSGEESFQDNDNVLIEAGMFREREVSQGQATCLLVREANSPPCPFDIAGHRILYVPRENGVLNGEMFHAELRRKLSWLMANPA
jgi:hypothetical protein